MDSTLTRLGYYTDNDHLHFNDVVWALSMFYLLIYFVWFFYFIILGIFLPWIFNKGSTNYMGKAIAISSKVKESTIKEVTKGTKVQTTIELTKGLAKVQKLYDEWVNSWGFIWKMYLALNVLNRILEILMCKSKREYGMFSSMLILPPILLAII